MTAIAERTLRTSPIEPKIYRSTVELSPVQHTQETLHKWTEWLQDPNVGMWMIGDLPQSPAEINEWLYNATHDPKRHYFTIRKDGRMIGILNLRVDHMPDHTGEIGIVIGEINERGKGIGTHVVTQAMEYAKDDLQLHVVRAHIKPENEKSIRLFTGQGFELISEVTISSTPMLRFEKKLV